MNKGQSCVRVLMQRTVFSELKPTLNSMRVLASLSRPRLNSLSKPYLLGEGLIIPQDYPRFVPHQIMEPLSKLQEKEKPDTDSFKEALFAARQHLFRAQRKRKYKRLIP